MNTQEEIIETNTIPFKDIVTSERLVKALEVAGFKTSTPVQGLTIPPALEQKDLVVEASTGSGKTLAFGIPLLVSLETSQQKEPYALIVSPTRELATQIHGVLSPLMEEDSVALLIGGMPYRKQQRALSNGSRVVVGTPGRILDFIDRRDLDLRQLKYFVLDEADEMFSMGFMEDVESILKNIPKEAQGLFVSATVSPRVRMLSGRFLNKPLDIVASKHDEKPPEIEHVYYNVAGDSVADKPNVLCDLLESIRPASAIIFCNTRSDTELVEAFMRRRGFDARRLNSDLRQSQRNKVMDRIRSGELRYLIATDIAARGIDIEQIELVVNYAIPEQTESYVHRTGRTGRAGRKGKAISLVGPHDFLTFQSLKSLPFELKKESLPAEEDLAVSRLENLHQHLKKLKHKVRPRDKALATRILREFGDLDAPAEELEEFVALMALYTVEHLVTQDSLSLEEELAQDGGDRDGSDNRRSQNSNNRNRRSNNRGRGNNRGGNNRRQSNSSNKNRNRRSNNR